jgi:transposase
MDAAHAANNCEDCYLFAQYHRLVSRRGGKEATIDLSHSLLVIIYPVLAEQKDYKKLRGNYLDERDRQAVQKRLVHHLKQLAYEVSLTPISPAT